jgi:hypothetical protein
MKPQPKGCGFPPAIPALNGNAGHDLRYQHRTHTEHRHEHSALSPALAATGLMPIR